jgi:hypothetical protein
MPKLTKFTRHQAIVFGFLAFALEGCATNQGMLAQSILRSPVKMVVLESPIDIEPGKLEVVMAPDSKQDSSATKALVKQRRTHAEEYAMTSMESSLAKQGGFEIVTAPSKAEHEFNNIQKLGLKSPITQEEANSLHDALGADAILRFGITDYGLTPSAWHDGYITFEVASTLAFAGIIAYSGSTVATAAAGTYLAQEAVEETTEAYAGFWALDNASRPVRIEAELIQLKPLDTVWKDSDTGLSDTKLSRLFRKVPVEEERQQLEQSTDEATKELAAKLSAALTRSRISKS